MSIKDIISEGTNKITSAVEVSTSGININPANIINGRDAGKAIATSGMSEQMEDLTRQKVAENRSPVKDTIIDNIAEIGISAGKDAADKVTYGVGGAIIEGVIGHAETREAHRDVIKEYSDQIPGVKHRHMEHDGKGYDLYADATGLAQGEDVIGETVKEREHGRDSHGRQARRIPSDVREAQKQLEAEATQEANGYMAEHGPDGYDQAIDQAIENKQNPQPEAPAQNAPAAPEQPASAPAEPAAPGI